ncbi:hypothetical protein DM02DRAFT_400771 [Periconia macrospinosa]|uniref:Uncharacterized protein n=1 Tax=Periconia macrospinosa TaxID=97972 RepID=A0A2V1DQD8_9PLEO|nr:hypothetical protein DM02DRAFT_400771 [Periconia macrospinosa]
MRMRRQRHSRCPILALQRPLLGHFRTARQLRRSLESLVSASKHSSYYFRELDTRWRELHLAAVGEACEFSEEEKLSCFRLRPVQTKQGKAMEAAYQMVMAHDEYVQGTRGTLSSIPLKPQQNRPVIAWYKYERRDKMIAFARPQAPKENRPCGSILALAFVMGKGVREKGLVASSPLTPSRRVGDGMRNNNVDHAGTPPTLSSRNSRQIK